MGGAGIFWNSENGVIRNRRIIGIDGKSIGRSNDIGII